MIVINLLQQILSNIVWALQLVIALSEVLLPFISTIALLFSSLL